jgi:riboflavin synthase
VFTGIIETTGTISLIKRKAQALSLVVTPDLQPYECAPGDSVAVDGVCLTLERTAEKALHFTAVLETLVNSTLSNTRPGKRVNCERAVRPADRLGGHFVLGHVDGVGHIVHDRNAGESIVRTVWVPESLRMFMARKGSVAIDGVSLTIAKSEGESIDVSLVPFTRKSSTLGAARPGDTVNIECDILARYIHHMLQHPGDSPGADEPSAGSSLMKKLELYGF